MKTILRTAAVALFMALVAVAAVSCTYLGKNKLEEKVDSLSKDLPKEITSVMKVTDLMYNTSRNVLEITYTWDVTPDDIAWTTAEERQQEVLQLVSIKKLDDRLPDLIDKARAGIVVVVHLSDGSEAATISYPNIATFDKAAKGTAKNVAYE